MYLMCFDIFFSEVFTAAPHHNSSVMATTGCLVVLAGPSLRFLLLCELEVANLFTLFFVLLFNIFQRRKKNHFRIAKHCNRNTKV